MVEKKKTLGSTIHWGTLPSVFFFHHFSIECFDFLFASLDNKALPNWGLLLEEEFYQIVQGKILSKIDQCCEGRKK